MKFIKFINDYKNLTLKDIKNDLEPGNYKIMKKLSDDDLIKTFKDAMEVLR